MNPWIPYNWPNLDYETEDEVIRIAQTVRGFDCPQPVYGGEFYLSVYGPWVAGSYSGDYNLAMPLSLYISVTPVTPGDIDVGQLAVPPDEYIIASVISNVVCYGDPAPDVGDVGALYQTADGTAVFVSFTKKVLISSDDTNARYLETALTAGTNVSLTVTNAGGDEQLQISSAPPDEKVKVSSDDTGAGYLDGELVAGTNIEFTVNDPAGAETLSIAHKLPTYAATPDRTLTETNDDWDQEDGTLRMRVITDVDYNTGTHVLSAYYRDLSFDVQGHLTDVTGATQFTIDSAEVCVT